MAPSGGPKPAEKGASAVAPPCLHPAGEGAAQYDAAQGFSGRCRNARHDARHARLSARRYERAACLLDLLALNRAARGSELTVAVNGEVFLQRVAQVEGDVDGHVCGEGLAESVELVEA